MPTLLALMTAGVSGYLVFKLIGGFSTILGGIVAFIVWVFVFYFMRRYISRLKP